MVMEEKSPLHRALGELDSDLSLGMNTGQDAYFADPQLPLHFSHGTTVRNK